MVLALPEAKLRDLSGRAFGCNDELGALLILSLTPGCQAAGASAPLMAQNPARYTVFDRRAISSLKFLGHWTEEAAARPCYAAWSGYLATCRWIAESTGRSLREVDRALYQANGRPASS